MANSLTDLWALMCYGFILQSNMKRLLNCEVIGISKPKSGDIETSGNLTFSHLITVRIKTQYLIYMTSTQLRMPINASFQLDLIDLPRFGSWLDFSEIMPSLFELKFWIIRGLTIGILLHMKVQVAVI